MNALPEFWAAVLGWLDLIAGRKDAADKFNLTPRGLINATGCYFAVVLLSLAAAALAGQNPGIIGAAVALLFNAAPLLAVWLVIGATALALKPQHGPLGFLVPATYAMALILVIRVPLQLLAPDLFGNTLLGALCFMLYRGARGVAGLGIGSALAFAALCAVALVLVTVGIYMLATGGAGIG
jgi:hypothetical protein